MTYPIRGAAQAQYQPFSHQSFDLSVDPKLTIRRAKEIVSELGAWARQFDHDEAKHLQGAIADLNRLLVRGWTEVDESLRHLKSIESNADGDTKARLAAPISMLNRWHDRGGRVGNAGRY